MPLYQITGPDGNLYEIEGPEGATRQQVISAVQKRMSSQEDTNLDARLQQLRAEREELLKPKPTVGGNVKEAFKGLVPGAVGLLETAGTGIASMLPDDTEKAAREKIKELAGIAKKPFEAGAGYEDSIGRKLGEGLGSTLPFFAAGPLGLAGRVAAGGLGVAAGAGEARESAEAKGATGSERRAATLLGAPTGLLDILAPEIKPFKSIMGTALVRGGVEGATEAAQKIAQNLIAKGVYDPKQEILVGSGEEGAYGAGVGALASLIIDMTVGRKARRAHLGLDKEAPAPETKAPEQQLLGYTAEPFTPVALPDGSVITSKAEYDDYLKSKQGTARQREEDLRTSDPLAGLSSFDRNLARRGKEAALEETFGSQEPDLLGDILPAKEAKVDEEVAPERDTQTRDMIDELENQQIEELQKADEEAKTRATREEAKAKAEKERLKFESELAELTGKVERKQEKTSEDTRLQLLLPIVESEVKNIPKAFVQTLKREGFTNTNLTDRERNLINRAYDIRLAEAPVAEAEAAVQAPESQKKELRSIESLIPEKKSQREPEQMGFPGMGKPKGAAPQAFSEEELASQEKPFTGRSDEAPRSYTSTAPFPTVLTPEVLTTAGLPKQSGFYKQLLNMDMADTAQQPIVANIFGRIRTNPNLSASTKDAVENLAMQAFGGLAKQGDMFVPAKPTKATKEGKKNATATKPAAGEPAERGRSKDAGDVAGRTGTRAEDRKESGAKNERTGAPADTKRTEAPKSAGLGDRGQPAGNAGTRAGVESSALKKTEPKAEAKTEAKKPLTAREMLDRAEEAQRKADAEAKGKPEAKAEKAKTEAKPKADASLGAYGQVMEAESRSDALDYLAYDMYVAMFEKHKLLTRVDTLNDINAQLRNGIPVDYLAFGREGTTSIVPLSGGKYAKAFYESLSAADKRALAKKMSEYFGNSEAEVRRGSTQFNVQQEISRATKEQMDGDELELSRDAVVLALPLHPAIRKALKAGDLRGALTMLGSQNLGRASEVAKKLAGAIGKTKIETEPMLVNAEDVPVAGLYDPKTDTIKLDAEEGLNIHVLLHEAVHAATSHVIDNKSHPVTKQLTELYNNVKDSLDTAYGAQSLDEFVAESFSNPEFQQKLAAINPKGEAITAWQRFMHAIRNFVRSIMGKGTKGMGTALDASDSLINAILSPAPESRNAGSLFSASLLGKSSAMFQTLDDRILSLPALDNKMVGGIYELFREGVPSAVKKLIRRSLPLDALTEVAKKDIPMAPRLSELEKLWNGAIDKRKRATEATMKRIQNWIKGNPEKEVILNDVIATSTLEQVDPSKPRADYKGKQSESGADKQKVWDDLQAQWGKLGPEGQSVYKQMRDTYAKTYEDLLDLMFSRIDNSVENKEDAKKLKTEIYQRLATKGKIEPYFPLTRNGDYRLSYDAKGRNGNLEHFVEHYETSVERERAIKELEKEGGAKNIQRFTGGSKKTYKDAPPTSFVNSILRTLEANKVDPEVTDEIMRTFLSTLPESSFAQAFRKRKNTPGFSFDATSAFFTRSMGMSHQLANLEYSGKMYQLRDEIDKHVKEKNNTEVARGMADELNNHIQTLVSPNISPWSKVMTSTAFSWTLGFNVSSALVNMSQVPLVMMPYLGGKYGYSETTKAIGSATRLFFGSGLKRNAEMTVPTADGKSKIELKAGFSLDNYDFDAKGVPENVKRLKELSQVAEDYGLLSRSMTHDILDMDEKSTPLNRVNAWSGFIFHHGERMNRQISLIASYELELDRMAKEGKKIDSAARTEAAKHAVQVTELMNGGASAGSAPLLAKNSIGKILFMYKRYGVSMYYMMFKTAREAMKSEDKKVRDAAMRQIVGIYASAGMMAGVQGLPMFGILAAVYNLFKGDDEDDAETAARKWLGEGMFNGAVNYLTDTAIANRIGLSDLLINSTGYREQDNAVLAFMQLMGGPVYGVADRLQQGAKLINDGETERGLERMLPAGISNGLKGIRFATEGANTLRGDPIVGDISAYNAGAQFLGFAPAEYTRQLEINASLKNIERRATKERTKMLRDYYIAARNGDSDGMSDAMDDMLKFNRSHPTAAITAETIQNSMAQHMKTSQEMYHGVTLNKKLRGELLQNASEYDNGLLD
jgi:hypothetical protein